MFINDYIKSSIEVKERILADKELCLAIEDAAIRIVKAYKNEKKVLLAGNGGSAADAQHLATELVVKFYKERKPLSAFSLSTDTSVLTAIGNDCGFEDVFARQIHANGNKDDIFIAISTSGNSKNIINAILAAKEQGLFVIGLTGSNANSMDSLCDIILKVPSLDTPKIQESHIMIGHIICAIVEKQLFDNSNND